MEIKIGRIASSGKQQTKETRQPIQRLKKGSCGGGRDRSKKNRKN
jgi:hypothetical protein